MNHKLTDFLWPFKASDEEFSHFKTVPHLKSSTACELILNLRVLMSVTQKSISETYKFRSAGQRQVHVNNTQRHKSSTCFPVCSGLYEQGGVSSFSLLSVRLFKASPCSHGGSGDIISAATNREIPAAWRKDVMPCLDAEFKAVITSERRVRHLLRRMQTHSLMLEPSGRLNCLCKKNCCRFSSKKLKHTEKKSPQETSEMISCSALSYYP